MFDTCQIWERLHVHQEPQLFVDATNMAGKKDILGPMWKIFEKKDTDLEEAAP